MRCVAFVAEFTPLWAYGSKAVTVPLKVELGALDAKARQELQAQKENASGSEKEALQRLEDARKEIEALKAELEELKAKAKKELDAKSKGLPVMSRSVHRTARLDSMCTLFRTGFGPIRR